MVRLGLLAVAMLVTLSGCDVLELAGFGGNESENVSANQSAGAKDPPTTQNLQFADAGVTSSRSLQPVAANASHGGEKDPTIAATFDGTLLLGRWGDFGDCSKNVIEFVGDGTFRAANGGTGYWDLDGDQLTFSGDQGEVRMRLESLEANRLTVVQANGTRGQSQRC